MAKIVTGALISDIRNKQGNIVYARNRYGLYTRAMHIPIQPKTVYQQASWTQMRLVILGWRNSVTDVQRALLADFGADIGATHKFTGKTPLTGFQAYFRLNQARLFHGYSLLAVPPQDRQVTQPTQPSISTALQLPLSVAFTIPTQPAAGELAVVTATKPQLASITTFRKNLWWLVDKAPGFSSPIDVTDLVGQRFGPFDATNRIGVGVQHWREANSAFSVKLTNSTLFANSGKTNLLLNPDLELGGLGNQETNWTVAAANGLLVANDFKKHGTYSGKTVNAVAANSSSSQLVGGLSPGNYTFQAYVRASALAGLGQGALFTLASSPGFLDMTTSHNNNPITGHTTVSRTGINTAAGTQDWTFCNMTFALPAGQNGIYVFIDLGRGNTVTGTAWYDYLCLTTA